MQGTIVGMIPRRLRQLREQRDIRERERWMRETIAEYGWAIQHVGPGEDGEAPFSYTIGLTAMGHPELVMTAMPYEVAQDFLNLAGLRIRDGYRFEPATLDSALTDDARVALITATDTSGLVGVEIMYDTVSAVQIIWPDSLGNLPWEDGYRNQPDVQQLLGPLPAEWTTR